LAIDYSSWWGSLSFCEYNDIGTKVIISPFPEFSICNALVSAINPSIEIPCRDFDSHGVLNQESFELHRSVAGWGVTLNH
jgi:hypothetical protein